MTTSFLKQSPKKAVHAVMRRHLDIAQVAVKDLVQGKRTKSLHDFRVALRHVRVWLEIITFTDEVAHRKTIKQLKHLTKITNRARDAEVRLEVLEKTILLLHLDDALLRHYRLDVEATYKAMRKDLTQKFVPKDILSLKPNFDADPPFEDIWHQAVAHLIKKTLKRLKSIHSLSDIESTHRARIAIKKLRYVLEPAKKCKPWISPLQSKLSVAQDELGNLHDLSAVLHDAWLQKHPRQLKDVQNILEKQYTDTFDKVVSQTIPDLIKTLQKHQSQRSTSALKLSPTLLKTK